MNCELCKQRCYPENPAQPFNMHGRYLPALCDSCQVAPERPSSTVVEHVYRHSDMSNKDYAQLQQTTRKVDWLEKRLNERAAKKPLSANRFNQYEVELA